MTAREPVLVPATLARGLRGAVVAPHHLATAASEIWPGWKPWCSVCSGNRGSTLENWKIDWLNHSPIEALTAIHVGARSQMWGLRRTVR